MTLCDHISFGTWSFLTTDVAMWGYSLTGLLTLYAAATRPSQFLIAFAGSPTLWWNCGRFASSLAHSQALNGVLRPKMYIDVGGAEGRMTTDVTLLVHQILTGGGYVDGKDTWLYIEPGDYHDPIAWTRRSLRGLLALFGTAESQELVYSGATASEHLYAVDVAGQVSKLWQRSKHDTSDWSGLPATLAALPVVFGFFGVMGAIALFTTRQQLRLRGHYESMGSSLSRTLEMSPAPGSNQLRLAPILEEKEWVDL